MSAGNCLKRGLGGHRWDVWLPYDEHALHMVAPYRYYRRCQIMFCDAEQHAERLEPAGAFKEVES